jgi:hypothetical protein
MPVNLATWEAEVGGSPFQASPGKKVSKTLPQKQWWNAPVIPAMWEAEVEGSQSRPALGKSVRYDLKNN